MALGFLAIEGPQRVGAAIEISYHSLFLGLSVRVTIDGASIDTWVINICYFLFMSEDRDIGGYTVDIHLVQRSHHVQLEFVTHPEIHFGRLVSSHVWWRHRVQTDVRQLLEPCFLWIL